VQTLTRSSNPFHLSSAWREEVRGIVRAFSGAFLFGVPLLYTMEMWWLGDVAAPRHLLLTLGIALIANFGLVTAAGFKRETSLFGRIEQTVDAVAVGAVGATVVLLTLNQLNPDQAPRAILGKIVMQALPLSIGASLANIVFGRHLDREGDDDDGSSDKPGAQSEMPGVWHALFNDVGATAIGAMFISATVAPTEEVPMLAARMEYWHLLALIGLTLVTGYIIVFASGFDPAARRDRRHLFQHPASETALSYLLALAVSLGVLLLTRQVGSDDPPAYVLTQTLVLGLPAMVGGAAGRIAV
jgi:putative integral membrane protein (TIGR02587 family)